MKVCSAFMAAMAFMRVASCALAAIWIVMPAGWTAAQSPSHPYRTASAIGLAGRLQAPCLQRVEGISVREQIEAWSIEHQILIWLDRRIASDTLVSLGPAEDRSLLQALHVTCDQLDAELAIIDRVVLIVPSGRAAGIECAYWKLLVEHPDAAWCRPDKRTWSWEDGDPVESIWLGWQQQYRVEFTTDSAGPGLDFERDRWRRFRWDNVTPLAVGMCLLSGFDRTFQADGQRLRIAQGIPHQSPEPVTWLYRDEIPKVGKEAWTAWRQRWPDASVSKLDSNTKATWKIVAPVAAHRELMATFAPPPAKPAVVDRARKRFTGRYRGELLRILEGFANQMSLELQSPLLPMSLARMEIDIDFQDLSVEEIAKKISIESGLKLTVEVSKLRVEMK